MWRAVGLLALSNVFMTFAWCAHLRDIRSACAPRVAAAAFMFRG